MDATPLHACQDSDDAVPEDRLDPDHPIDNKFVQVSRHAVAWNATLSDGAVRVYLALIGHIDPVKRTCFPSQATLARLTGKTDRSVRRAITELQEAEMIAVVDHKLSSGYFRRQNIYWAPRYY